MFKTEHYIDVCKQYNNAVIFLYILPIEYIFSYFAHLYYIKRRRDEMFNIKVKSVKPLKNQILEVEFTDGETKLYDVKQLYDEFEDYKILANDDIFNLVKIDCGGRAVTFTEDIDITEYELYTNSIK